MTKQKIAKLHSFHEVCTTSSRCWPGRPQFSSPSLTSPSNRVLDSHHSHLSHPLFVTFRLLFDRVIHGGSTKDFTFGQKTYPGIGIDDPRDPYGVRGPKSAEKDLAAKKSIQKSGKAFVVIQIQASFLLLASCFAYCTSSIDFSLNLLFKINSFKP